MTAIIRAALVTLLLLTMGCERESSNNGGQSEDRAKLACVVATDFYMVHLTSYLEPTESERNDRKKAFSPYCQDLPRVGKSYLTVDLLDADVKAVPIRARVLRKLAQGGGKEIIALPPRTYPTAIVELVAELVDSGEYEIELGIGRTVADEDTVRIPLRVGLRPSLAERWPQIGLGLLALFGTSGLALLSVRLWRWANAPIEF